MPYQVGDIVEIVDEYHGHEFEIGEHVRIVDMEGWCDFDEEYSYGARSLNDNGDLWSVFDCELALVSSAIPPKPKIKGFAKWIMGESDD